MHIEKIILENGIYIDELKNNIKYRLTKYFINV